MASSEPYTVCICIHTILIKWQLLHLWRSQLGLILQSTSALAFVVMASLLTVPGFREAGAVATVLRAWKDLDVVQACILGKLCCFAKGCFWRKLNLEHDWYGGLPAICGKVAGSLCDCP